LGIYSGARVTFYKSKVLRGSIRRRSPSRLPPPPGRVKAGGDERWAEMKGMKKTNPCSVITHSLRRRKFAEVPGKFTSGRGSRRDMKISFARSARPAGSLPGLFVRIPEASAQGAFRVPLSEEPPGPRVWPLRTLHCRWRFRPSRKPKPACSFPGLQPPS